MTVQPILATHRITFDYTVHALAHRMQVLCTATPTGVGTGHVLTPVTGSPIPFTTASNNLGAEFAATLLTTDSIGVAVLEEYSGGAYIPVETNPVALLGTQTATGTPYSRITGFYRDASFNPMKIVVIADTYFTPFKIPDSGLPSPFDLFWESFRTAATGRAGMWAQSRSAKYIAANSSVVGSLDRKSRRRAGLA